MCVYTLYIYIIYIHTLYIYTLYIYTYTLYIYIIYIHTLHGIMYIYNVYTYTHTHTGGRGAAWEHTKKVLSFGARSPGDPGWRLTHEYIWNTLQVPFCFLNFSNNSMSCLVLLEIDARTNLEYARDAILFFNF